jgi:glutamate synthase domain-containing protein 2
MRVGRDETQWPVARFIPLALCIVVVAVAALFWPLRPLLALLAAVAAMLALLGIYDLVQPWHSILRNYPITGHFRWLFESIRPQVRQYLIESDNERTPFSRSQRSLVYARAKNEGSERAFGTLLDVYGDGYEFIAHSARPAPRADPQTFRIWIGGDECSQRYSASIFNISAMSFGSLSANAIRALNKGARIGGFYHDTGEGSISPYHREHGGDLVWEIGSGYFGCRTADGHFDPEAFARKATDAQVKMVEVKLSQGAKPGHGGILPGPKVTAEIAATRGVPEGQDCVSPARHRAFSTPIEMMQFIAELRKLSGGKPVGFKLCIGHPWEWFAIAKAMHESGITPDFIVVDGAEGGTGAAPLEFTNHVGAPLQEGLLLVHNTLVGLNLRNRIKVGCAGKVVSAFDIARMMALGADWCNAGRGFMFALGCIQAQQCHTGKCPTGVSTQDPQRMRALVVNSKSERVFQFHRHTLMALRELVQAAGLDHPGAVTAAHIVHRCSDHEVKLLANLLPFVRPGALLAGELPNEVFRQYWPMASAASFAAASPFTRFSAEPESSLAA